MCWAMGSGINRLCVRVSVCHAEGIARTAMKIGRTAGQFPRGRRSAIFEGPLADFFGLRTMNTSPVSNVSDTARWVAVYRAWESARADALFHDPYADLLAGERGRAIAALMPAQARSGWPII